MTASPGPTVSVLMAVHNGLRHLPAAIQSVLEQSFTEFEFIIVDDASDEPTRSFLDGLTDPRVRILRNERNLGLTASLNRGLATCRGRFIARMDSDDVCEPHRFAEQVSFLRQNRSIAACGTWTTDIDDDDAVTGAFEAPGHPDYIRWSLSVRSVVIHPSVMLRQEAVTAVAGYDERYRYAQDFDLFTRLAMSGHQLAILERPLLRYRRGAQSITSTKTTPQRHAADEIRRTYLAHLLQRPITGESATAYHALMSLQPLPPSPQVAEGLVVAADVWRRIDGSADQTGRAIVRQELVNRLLLRVDEALVARPRDAMAIARTLARIPGHRADAARAWIRALRCDLGLRRRKRFATASPDEKARAT